MFDCYLSALSEPHVKPARNSLFMKYYSGHDLAVPPAENALVLPEHDFVVLADASLPVFAHTREELGNIPSLSVKKIIISGLISGNKIRLEENSLEGNWSEVTGGIPTVMRNNQFISTSYYNKLLLG